MTICAPTVLPIHEMTRVQRVLVLTSNPMSVACVQYGCDGDTEEEAAMSQLTDDELVLATDDEQDFLVCEWDGKRSQV